MSSQSILQSGTVTPSHLATWVTDGVIGDGGVPPGAVYGEFRVDILAVNFNATNTDNPINIALPAGFTRYRITNILISGASATLSTATCGVFTATAAGGTAIVTTGTAVTITSSLTDTNNNLQNLTIVNQNTLAWSDGTIYFRVQTPQSAPGTANVSVFYKPLP